MIEIDKNYYISVDGELFLGIFVGFFGSSNNLLEFDICTNLGKKRSILFTAKEAKESVLGYGD